MVTCHLFSIEIKIDIKMMDFGRKEQDKNKFENNDMENYQSWMKMVFITENIYLDNNLGRIVNRI